MADFSHTFPAARGVQSGRPCYVAMCPMRLIPKIFIFDSQEVPPELRAQRTLNRTRVPDIVSYLVENPTDYTLSAITASIDAHVSFEPSTDTGLGQNLGLLSIPMDAKILINDGQHRREAIIQAIEQNPELGYDNIPVLFFIDEGLQRSQQMFADLNKHAVRPSDSISTLYDHRDAISKLARSVAENVTAFSRLTEMEKSSISNRSSKLFTLSAIKNASKTLLAKGKGDAITQDEQELAIVFWNEVSVNMQDWQLALEKKVATCDLREQYIHSHGVMLQAMGHIGAGLLYKPKSQWSPILKGLQRIDWARANREWEGRAMHHGRISKARSSVVLTGNYIKHQLGIALTESEREYEEALKQ
ncbi:DNA sulfur modification protein DndB [Halomonas heilongjiangensis]|uniref:DNA sulfur modification protein DndB n=1 Tax=Halomonas heilongjiangensis TaxID=1387883 RepID=A0A2N7TQD3_9GAMM|nr:DNA sulfur modification protein DndB [Halomonas heilongjiangensis]PMR70411.1 DNA sulfur modification protein DndB [Halomonas heilongjiangensis]PXX91371.1 DNA sulfur modification protein DndB [Halomonas heilongjiangensis]